MTFPFNPSQVYDANEKFKANGQITDYKKKEEEEEKAEKEKEEEASDDVESIAIHVSAMM